MSSPATGSHCPRSLLEAFARLLVLVSACRAPRDLLRSRFAA